MLAVLLSPSAGAVDIIGYLRFDHVFVANMSGNTVLFASDLISSQFSQALNHFLPIAAFLAGVVTAKVAFVRLDRPSWPGVGLCLILVSGLWTAAAVLIPNLGTILIPVLAFSMGAQNATLTRVDKIPVNTAFITGNLEKLGEAIASLSHQPGSRVERLKLLAVGSIWFAYELGAAAGALAAMHLARHSLLLPAAVLCCVALVAFAIHFRTKWDRANPAAFD